MPVRVSRSGPTVLHDCHRPGRLVILGPPMRPPTSVRTSALFLLAAVSVLAAACQSTTGDGDGADTDTDPGAASSDATSPALTAPRPTQIAAPDDPVDDDVARSADRLFDGAAGAPSPPDVDRLAMSGDLRQGWLLVDLLRFADPNGQPLLVSALERLTAQALPAGQVGWAFYGELLLGWDVPAPQGYEEHKRALFVAHDPDWAGLLADAPDIDWRVLGRSGTGRDEIVALDDPEVVPAGDGAWLPDDEVVFAVEVAGDARAYPRRVLEVHEVVNDVVGGTAVVVSWCRWCDGAVAHEAARTVAGSPVRADATPLRLRDAGLVDGATDLLYESETGSLVRTIDGAAVSGPLREQEVRLAPLTLMSTTWGEWRHAHPDGTVVSDDGGVGRVYVADPIGVEPGGTPAVIGAPAAGLDAGAAVLGVHGPEGPVAFDAAVARQMLAEGLSVEAGRVRVSGRTGGLAALDIETAEPLVSATLDWWAWSRAYPGGTLWVG